MKDPVCGMDVTSEVAAVTYEWQGGIYYFCSNCCRDTFIHYSANYAEVGLKGVEEKSKDGTLESKEYTCQLHSEIVQGQPGSCPKCGRAMELRVISEEEEENLELSKEKLGLPR